MRFAARMVSNAEASDIIDESGNTSSVTRSLSALEVNILIAQIVKYIALKCNHSKKIHDMIRIPSMEVRHALNSQHESIHHLCGDRFRW
jgi:hypothetical protein